jgi:hypothetical protein
MRRKFALAEESINAGSVTYFVTIRNDGGTQSVYDLEGGGLT